MNICLPQRESGLSATRQAHELEKPNPTLIALNLKRQAPDLAKFNRLTPPLFRPYLQYGRDFLEEDFPEEILELSGKPGNALRVFPKIPLESRLVNPIPKIQGIRNLQSTPTVLPPPVQLEMPRFSELVPERAPQS